MFKPVCVRLQLACFARTQSVLCEAARFGTNECRPWLPGNIILSCDPDTSEAVAACAIILAKVGTELTQLGNPCNLCDYPADDFASLGIACSKARAIVIFLSNGSMRSLQQLAVTRPLLLSRDERRRDMSFPPRARFSGLWAIERRIHLA